MITISNLDFIVDNKKIVKDINLNFSKGKITSIIGKNGSGKTSLLKCIASLYKYDGSILFNNIELKEFERKERARHIAYLPQENPIPDITVRALVEHGRFPHLGFGRTLSKSDREKIDHAVEITNIRELLNKNLKFLSGGERQRVYLAMIIAQDTQVLLLDEPTTFLDINYQLEIFEILKFLKNKGKTIILVIHDLQQAFSYSDNIVLLDNGIVKKSDVCENMVNDKDICEIFKVNVNINSDANSIYKYNLTLSNE